jgi:hypothetical protein
MRTRRTAKDSAFAAEFGKRLEAAFQKHVKDKSNPKRLSVDAFARSLNLTRAGLHKAKRGKSVPELDLIERARQYNVFVGYGDLSAQVKKRKSQKHHKGTNLQLFLPFAVENLKKDSVRVELGEHVGDSVEVKVWIKFAG